MGTGWRRAFCNTVGRDKREVSTVVDKQQQQQQSLSSKLAGSNPTTPRLRCKTTTANNVNSASPRLNSKTSTTPKSHSKSPTSLLSSNPSSPRSPFSILKNTLRLSRSSCGVCMQSVKSGQRTAIYTAECSHVFHFPCITSHVTKQEAQICPVCNKIWKDVPFLSIHHNQNSSPIPSPKYSTKLQSYSDDVTPQPKQFLVNPNSKSSTDGALTSENVVGLSLLILPEAAVISVGRTHMTYAVVLKVKAPPPPHQAARRAPIDLVTVVDVSGAKIEMLKRALRLVVCSLGSADRLSIVAFSSTPKRLVPLMKMNPEGQRLARLIIDRLTCSHQGTSMGMAEALKQATKVLQDRRERNPVASIILLSDDDDTLPIPIPTNNHQGQDAFSKCVGELLSVVVQDLTIQIASDPAEITAVYSANGSPTVFTPGLIRIGDLYAQEERELLLEMRVPIGFGSHHHVFSVRCNYRNHEDQMKGREHALLVPRPQTARSPKIERLRNGFISTRAVAESRRLIEQEEALALLSSARALLVQSELGGEYVRALEAELLWRRRRQHMGLFVVDDHPTSRRTRTSDLHGFENARF